MAMQETGEVSHVEHLAAESDFQGGACAPPFCAVGRLSAHFKHLIGLLETAVDQASRGFLKVLGGVDRSPIQCQTLLDFYRISMETF